MDRVTDELGLCIENAYLTVFFPAKESALVFRVKARVNRGSEIINYGHLPIASGETLSSLDGGTGPSAPADGVIPARAYTGDKTFPMANAYDTSDMWYLPEDYRERIFHVIQIVTPAFLRTDIRIPTGVPQGRFQRDKIITGVDKTFGFGRGRTETVHLHKVHYGYRYANDTNVPFYTFVKFIYGEYLIEIPQDPELIFYILTKKVPSHWVSLPITFWDDSIKRALSDTFGIEGFRLYGVNQREVAISDYSSVIGRVKR
jgi:hypothetical protein